MRNNYIISDPHFSHENIIKYSTRPFKNADEMNEALINNWNSVVTSSDTVYVLGDVAFKKNKLSILNLLNGRKILIPGNHDIYEVKEYLKYFDDVRGYMIKENIIFSHIPVHPDELLRFIGNIHGHLHEKTLNDKRYYSVCVEQINYTPILLDTTIQNLKLQVHEIK